MLARDIPGFINRGTNKSWLFVYRMVTAGHYTTDWKRWCRL